MKKLLRLSSIFFLLFSIAFFSQAQSFVVNKNASQVKWNGKKVTGEHHGTINLANGTLQVANGQVASGSFEMDMASIVNEDLTDAGYNKRLVDHLKSDDFFSVENHPVSRLTISSVKKLGGNEYEYTGNLTIKGITNPVTFTANTSVNGNALKAEGKMVVNRTKYDIKFRSGTFFQNLGDNLIYDDFTLDFTLVANAQ